LRFQTTKRIPRQDPDQVLGVLEGCLRSVSNEIVRDGRRITLFGLGPSPRAVNPRDTTVIHIGAEDGVTTIHADVIFQASAFLGNAPQHAVVQEKLDRVFEEMRTRLGVDSLPPSSADSTGEPIPFATPRPSEVVPEPPPDPISAIPEPILPQVEVEPEAFAEPSLAADSASIAEPISADTASLIATLNQAAEAPVVQPNVEPIASLPPLEQKEDKVAVPEVTTAPYDELEIEKLSEPVVETQPSLNNESNSSATLQATAAAAPLPTELNSVSSTVTSSEPLAQEPKKQEPALKAPDPKPVSSSKVVAFSAATAASLPKVPPAKAPSKSIERQAPPEVPKKGLALDDETFEAELARKSRQLKWGAWVAAVIVLVVAPAAWLYLPSHSTSGASALVPQAPAAEAAPNATPASDPAPAEPSQVVVKEPGADPDPGVMVTDWEAAMDSNDAAAQAAFYSNPVERYFLRRNLDRNQVLEDKQTAIGKRRGQWGVKMEQVQLTRQGATGARVHLVKHFTVQENGKTVSEWFVPSLLQLTRTNGRWQIISERDLGWAASMEELATNG
jgi:ketosteroid isomerase-like protein